MLRHSRGLSYLRGQIEGMARCLHMSSYGVAIVTHNSEAEIGGCLEALQKAGAAGVVVIDNASCDGTVAAVRKRSGVRLIANPWNRGFAAAANQGVAAVERECVLLLNPDAEVLGGLDAMAETCCADGVAAVGGRLVDPAGRLQEGFMVRRLPTAWTLSFEALGLNRIWPGNPVNRRYRCAGFDATCAAEVEQPAGAFLMVRREAWRRLGGFDESFYPLWFEDVDFARRARQHGYRILYLPTAAARHTGGHSLKRLSHSSREVYWYATLLSYASKHFRRGEMRAVAAAVMIGAFARAVFGTARKGSPRSTIAAARVIRLGGRCMIAGRSESAGLFSAFAGV